MHARVTRAKWAPERIEDITKTIRDVVIPTAKKLPGFKRGYWLVDRKTGQSLGLTLFESEATLNASEDAAAKLRERGRESGATFTVERYEVLAEA